MKNVSAFIERISLLCWNSAKYRHLLFFVLTMFVLCAYGYYFGTFDQSSHIPFLKKTIDPSLFPEDRFFDLRTSHYSYFWLLFIPFHWLGILEITMFLVYAGTTYLTFWALWDLSKTLFHNRLTTFLATTAMALPHIGFSGFPLFEFSLLNRTVVFPFELFAIRLYLEKKYALSFFLLGILYNFHALSVHFVLAMMGMDILLSLIKKRDTHAFVATPFFFVSALPIFIWKFNHSGVPMNAQWEWFNLLNMSTFFHLFNFFSLINPVVNLLSAGGISALILFFIVQKYIEKNRMHEAIVHFMYGGILILLVQQCATLFYPLAIIVQTQIIRIATFLTLFTYLYVAHVISIKHRGKDHFICFVTSLFLSFSPLVLFISLLFWRTTQIKILRLITVIICVLFCMTLAVLLSLNLARPGIHIWPEKTAFYDAQMWAKNNTPRTARFLTPPGKWWLYDLEWRVVSERSTISTLSELLEGAFDPSYIAYWRPRFEDVAPGAIKQFKGNSLANLRITDEAYYHHSTNEFIALGSKYQASYLVVDILHPQNLPMAYQNQEYIIYSLNLQMSE